MAAKTQPISPPEPAELSEERPHGSRLGLRELALACIGLSIAGIVAYAPHILNGGFYLDDWANGAGTLRPAGGPSVGHALSYFSGLTLYRPVLVLYVPLTYFVFGTHMAYQLAWATVLAIVVAILLYGILRTLAVPWFHAGMVAVLSLVYPWFDSTRLWETASQASLSIIFAAAGLWLALAMLRHSSPRYHAASGFLYLLSILTYEVTLPLVATAGLLYTLCAGWRVARLRWLVDIAVAGVGGLWVGLQTNHESMGMSADLHHLKEIIVSGGTILGRTLIPFGPEPHTALALALLGSLVVCGVASYRYELIGTVKQSSWGSSRTWLVVVAGGFALAVLGWIMYIPANPYYTPSVYGFTNRVNALAGFGLIIAVYGTLGIAGSLLGALVRRPNSAMAVTVVLGLLLGAAYVDILQRHTRIWNSAFRAEMAGIGVMRTQFPRLRSGTTLFTSDYPAYQTLGVPIFSAGWDVNGMVKLQYKDGTLSAYPLLPGLRLACRAKGVALQGPGAPPVTASYGTAILLDMKTGHHNQPMDQAQCQQVTGGYTPGPLYLSLTY
jgi:hypothetical protein